MGHRADRLPFVDAGMRQLLGEAWVHDRVRMVVPPFLTKDLRTCTGRRGARHFVQHLRDGDLAPCHRVLDPVKQGQDHDPDGDDIRRRGPELRGVERRAVHAPWTLPGGPPAGYPPPVVDHRAEREEALRRYTEVRDSGA